MGGLNWSIPVIDAKFWAMLGQILFINLILFRDNAVVIAMAVNKLAPVQKKWGIILGSSLAALLRVILSGIAFYFLTVPFLRLVSGILILCVVVKLFVDNAEAAPSLETAILTILIADYAISSDIVLAVTGAANGGMFLILIGFVAGIPLAVFWSAFYSMLMNRFPILFTIGAAILGLVGGDMIIGDKWIVGLFGEGRPSSVIQWAVKIFFAVAVIVVGKLIIKKGGGHGDKSKDFNAPAQPDL